MSQYPKNPEGMFDLLEAEKALLTSFIPQGAGTETFSPPEVDQAYLDNLRLLALDGLKKVKKFGAVVDPDKECQTLFGH
jgi:hypothetical protein